VIGLSGGVDSTYTAYVVKQLGLRPLAVHLDNGWNSEVAVRNIENLVTRLGIDLHTEVLDWDEFRDLQLAFLRASTPDSEVPTDHAIIATLYRVAKRERIGWIIEGSNIVTEVMLPQTWSRGHGDWKYIRSVGERFGTRPLRTFPHYSMFEGQIGYPKLHGIRRLAVLNYLDYDKPQAIEVMKRELGWEYYGGKHYESVYTRFYQGYILVEKFGFDKRRSHLSCLVNNGRLTRADAVAELGKPTIEPVQLREDRAFVVKKLGISDAEFSSIMALPKKTFWDYPSYEADIAARAPGCEAYWVSKVLRSLERTGRTFERVKNLHRLPSRAITYVKRRLGSAR
jgi:N-acetyl sugar amidotransferase